MYYLPNHLKEYIMLLDLTDTKIKIHYFVPYKTGIEYYKDTISYRFLNLTYNLIWFTQNHPHQYVFFNFIAKNYAMKNHAMEIHVMQDLTVPTNAIFHIMNIFFTLHQVLLRKIRATM